MAKTTVVLELTPKEAFTLFRVISSLPTKAYHETDDLMKLCRMLSDEDYVALESIYESIRELVP